MKVTTTEDPPKLMSGNGIPVTGMIPIVTPTFTNTCVMNIAAIEPAITLPYKFFERVMMRSALHMSRAKRDKTKAAPTKPKRSPTTEKMKSVVRSGTKPCSVCVESDPRPVLPPDPIAISD